MTDFVKIYGNYIKKAMDTGHTSRAQHMIQAGLTAEKFRVRHFSDQRMPQAYRQLNELAVKSVHSGLRHPEHYAWTNIFAPVEILECFGLNCISIECISSFLSGFEIEDGCIDYAENHGIAPTLCSYHKNFIGGVLSGIIPPPVFATTTSMICDGNINTFHYLSKKYSIPHYILDIPDEYSREAEDYVVHQLEELIEILESTLGQKLDMDELKRTLERENRSKADYAAFCDQMARKDYPTTMTLQMYLLFATHLQIGTPQTEQFFHALRQDVASYPDFKGKRILWVHLFPYYQQTLKQYLNFGTQYAIQCGDMNLDYMEPLDSSQPLHALARKMLLNVYNGAYERKIDMISDLVDRYHPDALIHFCHWGCKQSSGGVMLLKQRMKEKGIPLLILDGDAVDRRNSHDGQIRTRIEAFLELIDAETSEGGTQQ